MATKEWTTTSRDGEWLIVSDGELSSIAVIQATNRQALIDTLATYKGEMKEGKPLLFVSLFGEEIGCSGGSVEYPTIDDIPYQSVPCPCGNPKHWLIKYGEEP